MSLLKILGALDIYSAVVMILVQLEIIEWRLIFTATAYLLIKGYMFKGEPASMLDFAIGAYHIIMILFPIPFITIVLALYLTGKGMISFM